MVSKLNVMDDLMSGQFAGIDDDAGLHELIYRDPVEVDHSGEEQHTVGQVWTASKDRVTIQTWESRATIKISLNNDLDRDISMRCIAEKAVRAIVEELRGTRS